MIDKDSDSEEVLDAVTDHITDYILEALPPVDQLGKMTQADKDAFKKRHAAKLSSSIADFLGQEYKQVDGEWWLWSLGKPRRLLTADEVEAARSRGDID